MSTTITQPPKPVKRRRTTSDYSPPDAPGLTVEYSYSKGCKESGEWRYSLGSPAEPPSVEIVGINTADGIDILPWLTAYCFDTDGLADKILEFHAGDIEDARQEAADRKADEQREERE